MFSNRAMKTTGVPSSAETYGQSEIGQAQIATQASRRQADADLADQLGRLAEAGQLREQIRELGDPAPAIATLIGGRR